MIRLGRTAHLPLPVPTAADALTGRVDQAVTLIDAALRRRPGAYELMDALLEVRQALTATTPVGEVAA